jgi:hypothetical protein
MLSLLVITGILIKHKSLIIGVGEDDQLLHDQLGEEMAYMVNYDLADLRWFKVILPHYNRNIDPSYIIGSNLTKTKSMTEDQVLQSIISTASKFNYVQTQPDPNLLSTVGGNCQAIALFAHHNFSANGLQNGFVIGTDHVYNWVIVNGRKYSVDIVYLQMKEVI